MIARGEHDGEVCPALAAGHVKADIGLEDDPKQPFVDLYNFMMAVMSERIDRENRALDKALFLDIPGRYGREADSKMPDPSMSEEERKEYLGAIDRYRAAMQTLYRLTELPFVPADRIGRLRGQIRMVEEGSQSATLADLHKYGLASVARVLEEYPLCE